MEVLNKVDELEFQTRRYCVHIADAASNSQGSGLLYYPGYGDQLYVFTCAHVVDQAEDLEITLMLPENPEQDQYRECTFTVPAEQIVYSPLDEATADADGRLWHTHDVAVIAVHKDKSLELERTVYYVAEAGRNMPIYAQGYPGGWRRGAEQLLIALDRTTGTVKTNITGNAFFDFRVRDAFLDQGCRVLELEGFSGSPVWDAEVSEHSVIGLMSSGRGSNVYRGIVQAVRMRLIQSIMKNHWGVVMETKIAGIPEEDVENGGELRYDGTIPDAEDRGTVQDVWLLERQQQIRALVDELKLSKAIDLCREVMEDQRFAGCSKGNRLLLAKHLMYCYDTCLLEEDALGLEQRMRREGLIEEHDTSRWLTKLFMLQRYEDLLRFTAEIPESSSAYPTAKFFEAMAKAFVLGSPSEETVGLYVDDMERLRMPAEDLDTESFYLQVIGYVYDGCYHMPEKAIRCLNRSYRVNHKPINLETLGGAYYHLAIRDALNEKNQIILNRIDQENLYKARQCFLVIMEQEDELCFRGAIKRMGWEIFHTFAFLNDTYRVLTLYSKMKTDFPFKDGKARRDVEKIYADMMIRSGSFDASQFSALTQEDIQLFQMGAEINDVLHSLEPCNLQPTPAIRRQLFDLIMNAENAVEQMDADTALTLHRALIILYSNGIRLFGWDALAVMQWHYQRIQKSSNEQLIADMGDVIFECEHSFEENVQHFQAAYEEAPSVQSWNTLCGVYIRAGKLDEAEAMYQDLLSNHKELYRDTPEYAYRGYLDFIRNHRRDLKNAIKYFLESKEIFDDQDIAGFWEMELRFCAGNFNEPERFEEERYHFVADGLIPPETYYQGALFVYMQNLNGPKADEMFQKLPHAPSRNLTWEEVKYLVWRKMIEPVENSDWQGMVPEKIAGILDQYAGETWGDARIKARLINRLQIDRVCALDAWSLYLLAVQGKLDVLQRQDQIYIPHAAVNHLLEELSKRPNALVRRALDYIESCNNICICSPNFSSQLNVREKVRYDEPACVLALALEKGCAAVIGDPYTGKDLLSTFFADILRPPDIFG